METITNHSKSRNALESICMGDMWKQRRTRNLALKVARGHQTA